MKFRFLKPPIPAGSPHRQSLDISWKEGGAAAVMQAITDYYLTPLALFLGAAPQQIGLLVGIPYLMGSLSQLFAAPVVTAWKSRLRFLIYFCNAQAALFIPIAWLPLIPLPHRLKAFLVLVIGFRILANLIQTAWGGLASEYLPPDERGKYFGWRSKILAFAGVSGMLAGGLILFAFKKISLPLGFFMLFMLAAGARFLSAHLMTKMQDVPMNADRSDDFSFFGFLARAKTSNFAQFVFYSTSILFTTTVASPFFSVYMLRELQLDYLTYTAISLSATLAGIIAFPVWGRHADAVGNAQVVKVTGALIPLIPLFWLCTGNPFFLFLFEFYSGFVWGGFNLCSVNFVFDSVKPEQRVRCLGYFNLFNGAAIFLGSWLGGMIAGRMPALRGSSLCSLFLLSFLLRLAAFLVFYRRVHEVRGTTQRVSNSDLFFSVLGIKPILEDESRD